MSNIATLAAAGAHATKALALGGNAITYRYKSLEEAFPAVDPGETPLGSAVLLQIRQPMVKTAGGIILTQEDRKTDHYNTQIARIIAVGPLAFHNREDGKLWPEGAWVKVGDFVRVPKYQGERFIVPFEYRGEEYDHETRRSEPATVKDEVVFVIYNDLALMTRITSDPLTVRAFW